MNIALLNEDVIFQKSVVETDRVGNHMNAWKDFHKCKCTVSGEGGAETDEAGVTTDHSDMAVTIRWCRKASEIEMTGFRIVFHGELYNITGIDHMNYKKRCLKFRCRKERGSG